jgi:hypothetical protein
MCVFKKRGNGGANGHHGHDSNHHEIEFNYEITTTNLRDLMQLHGKETVDFIDQKYSGIDGLARALNTNVINGLSGDSHDLKQRLKLFGSNEIPPKPPKLFIQLVLDALKDTTLVILMVCAFVSIGLSFYHPPEEEGDERVTIFKERKSFHSLLLV